MTIRKPDSGLCFWLTFPPEVDINTAMDYLNDKAIGIPNHPFVPLALNEVFHMRLAFATFNILETQTGVKLLKQMFEDLGIGEISSHTDIPTQPKLYDKIVRENMHKVLPGLVKDVLGIDIVSREDLPESLQHTKETVPDQLCKVTDSNGNTYILHLEWQSDDDPSMDHRMLTYRAMLRRKYNLAVKQYVIFLARKKSTMPNIIDEENLKYSYNLIALQQYSHKIFLNSELPEQKLLAIFGNFDEKSAVEIIKEILRGTEQYADGELSAKRYIQQLRALIQLRKLTKEFKIAMGTITKFKVEKDPFYQDGVKKGRVEERAKALEEKKAIARNLKNKGIDLNIIAEATGLSTEDIQAL